MKWLAVTIAALAATVALVAWIYLRDRGMTNQFPSVPRSAHQGHLATHAPRNFRPRHV